MIPGVIMGVIIVLTEGDVICGDKSFFAAKICVECAYCTGEKL